METPDAPYFRRNRRCTVDDYVCVRFSEVKVYTSGHVEHNAGNRVYQKRPDIVSDDQSPMNRVYLTSDELFELEDTAMIRYCKYGDDLKFQQLILIKIT